MELPEKQMGPEGPLSPLGRTTVGKRWAKTRGPSGFGPTKKTSLNSNTPKRNCKGNERGKANFPHFYGHMASLPRNNGH